MISDIDLEDDICNRLGANHDGSDHEECKHDQGFITAGISVENSKNTYDWSLCSRKDLADFLNTHPKCLLNKPVGISLLRLLSGGIMDANEQCQVLRKTKAVIIDASICKNLKCSLADNSDFIKQLSTPAAEGTPCGDGRIWIHRTCLRRSLI